MPSRFDQKGYPMPNMFSKALIRLVPNLSEYICRLRQESSNLIDVNAELHRELALAQHELEEAQLRVPESDFRFAPVARPDALGMPVKFGEFQGRVYGGPYPKRLADIAVGVNMAAEIKLPSEIAIPTKDFSVPSMDTFKHGLTLGIMHLRKHGELYVGCMGGIGRTGLYMGGLAKVMFALKEDLSAWGALKGPSSLPQCVRFVRTHYKGHAIETDEQIEFIKKLDVSEIISALRAGSVIA